MRTSKGITWIDPLGNERDLNTDLNAIALTQQKLEDDMALLTAKLIGIETISWRLIKEVCDKKAAADHFNVGSKKTVTLTTGEVITLVILGFNQNTLTSGDTAQITFGMQNCLNTLYRLHGSAVPLPYIDTEFNTVTAPILFNQLPEEVKTLVKPVRRKLTIGKGNTSTALYDFNNIFLPSYSEVIGGDNIEGSQFPYYSSFSGSDFRKTANGVSTRYWLGSHLRNQVDAPYYYYATGSSSEPTGTASPTTAYGISYAFCI